jgi:hypothetical protein
MASPACQGRYSTAKKHRRFANFRQFSPVPANADQGAPIRRHLQPIPANNLPVFANFRQSKPIADMSDAYQVID